MSAMEFPARPGRGEFGPPAWLMRRFAKARAWGGFGPDTDFGEESYDEHPHDGHRPGHGPGHRRGHGGGPGPERGDWHRGGPHGHGPHGHDGPGPRGGPGGRGGHGGRGHGGPGGPGGFGPFGPGGFGPGGFGPGGFGPGGFVPGGPGGRGGFGPFGGGRGGRRRRSRGDVRLAILALLTEEPMHGYQIIQEISERSGWVWKPSPGSVYPAIQLLEDEGLISAEGAGGRRVVQLTEAGKAYATEHAEKLAAAFDTGTDEKQDRAMAEVQEQQALIGQLAMAMYQLAQVGSATEVAEAKKVLVEARRSLYRILAEADPESGADDETPDDQN